VLDGVRRSFALVALIAGAAASSSADAVARVGVTSTTDGDPLGKPPAEPERVLQVGLDIKADEVVTTRNDDRAHLVFLDGSTLTVGSNSRVVIDKFVFDPVSKKGELSLTASAGVFRLVGGKISKTSTIQVTTPSSTIGIRGGISIFAVSASQTVATFVFGQSLTVSGNGFTESVTRPGFQVTTNRGSRPGVPTLVPQGGLASSMGSLEATSSTNKSRSADADARAQQFSEHNSGLMLGANPFNPSFNPLLTNPLQQATNPSATSGSRSGGGTLPAPTSLGALSGSMSTGAPQSSGPPYPAVPAVPAASSGGTTIPGVPTNPNVPALPKSPPPTLPPPVHSGPPFGAVPAVPGRGAGVTVPGIPNNPNALASPGRQR
jgi:hypothetical protein